MGNDSLKVIAHELLVSLKGSVYGRLVTSGKRAGAHASTGEANSSQTWLSARPSGRGRANRVATSGGLGGELGGLRVTPGELVARKANDGQRLLGRLWTSFSPARCRIFQDRCLKLGHPYLGGKKSAREQISDFSETALRNFPGILGAPTRCPKKFAPATLTLCPQRSRHHTHAPNLAGSRHMGRVAAQTPSREQRVQRRSSRKPSLLPRL